MPSINEQILKVPVPYTKNLTESIKDNKDVINLARGDSEFQTPEKVIRYLTEILPDPGEKTTDYNSSLGKWTHYEKEKGSKRLREAIARKYKRESSLDVDPDCILITQGGMNAIFYSFLSIVNPGDEIIVPDPCYVAYDPISNYIIPGIKGVRIKLKEENDFILTPDQLDELKTEKTKALILTSPLNPTGSLYSKENLQAIMEWGIKNDVFIIHDENHEKEMYDGNVHYPISLFDEGREHSILLNSFSRLGMGGWRLGWMIGPKNVIKAASMAHAYVNMTCNTFVQEAGAYTLDNYESLGYKEIFKGYQDKRDIMVSSLNQLDGFKCTLPKCTCYAFPNIRAFYEKYKDSIVPFVKEQIEIKNKDKSEKTKKTELDLVNSSISYTVHKYLLYKAGVGVIPGIAYGPMSDDYVRFSFSVKKEAVIEGMRRLKEMYATI